MWQNQDSKNLRMQKEYCESPGVPCLKHQIKHVYWGQRDWGNTVQRVLSSGYVRNS